MSTAKKNWIANTIKNKAADVLSAPSRAYQSVRGANYDSDRKVLKDVKEYGDSPSMDDEGVTEAGKMRAMAKIVRDRMIRK